VSAIVNGKALFLVVQGLVQVGVIFVIAWLLHGVDLPGHIVPWTLTTVAASMAATGMALVIALACRTKRQAQTLANVAILVVSALGGSMVPRFFMPRLLQDLGWLTPNTWALEAYTAIFWRDEPTSALILPWAMLVAAGLVGLWVAQLFARRLEIS
jgi:ABC-2 type transport system permease protein